MAFSCSSSSSLHANPNITPLIDVLLVLLIIFMVIVPVSPRGLESLIPQPSAAPALPQTPDPVILHISASSADHRTVYQLDGRTVEPETLERALIQLRAQSTSQAVMIAGDPALDFQAVAAAVGLLKSTGFESVGLLSRAARPH